MRGTDSLPLLQEVDDDIHGNWKGLQTILRVCVHRQPISRYKIFSIQNMDLLVSMFNQFRKKSSTSIFLCRHGEGEHLTGDPFDERIGPSLTGRLEKGELTGGKGQAFRRVARQLRDLNIDVILSSPQMRALETTAYARLNEEHTLANGKLLSSVPVRILRNCYEQTACLKGQGNVVPPLSLVSEWPNARTIRNDKKLWSAIKKQLSDSPRQPKSDGRSAAPRAKAILNFIEKNYKNKTVLIIAHDGICRDIIYSFSQKRSEIFDLCEVRSLDHYRSRRRKTLNFKSPKRTKKRSRKKRTRKKHSNKK